MGSIYKLIRPGDSGLDESNPLVSIKSWGDKTPERLTEDYLTALYKQIMYTLEQKLGAALLRTIPLEFSLTVPAIWTEAAKDKTLKACQKAGFIKNNEDISLVSEPVRNCFSLCSFFFRYPFIIGANLSVGGSSYLRNPRPRPSWAQSRGQLCPLRRRWRHSRLDFVQDNRADADIAG